MVATLKTGNHFSNILCQDIFLRAIGLMSRVFTNGPGDRGSIPGRAIPKTQKMILDVAMLCTQHYKVKWSNQKEWSYTLPYTSI